MSITQSPVRREADCLRQRPLRPERETLSSKVAWKMKAGRRRLRAASPVERKPSMSSAV